MSSVALPTFKPVFVMEVICVWVVATARLLLAEISPPPDKPLPAVKVTDV